MAEPTRGGTRHNATGTEWRIRPGGNPPEDDRHRLAGSAGRNHQSDVVVTGDIFSPDRYPVIRPERGGSLKGTIDAVNRLLDIQHDHVEIIISAQHVHLDHDNCLEIIAVKGRGAEVKLLADALKSVKGVKHATLSVTSSR